MALRIIFSFFLGICGMIALALLILAFSGHVLLYPQVYEQALEDSNAYSILDAMTENKSALGTATFLKGDTKDILSSILARVLAYARGSSDVLNLSVEVDKVALRAFFDREALKVRVCDAGEDMYSGDEVKCRPAGANVTLLVDEILQKRNMSFFAGDYVDLRPIYDPDNNAHVLQDGVKIYYNVLLGLLVGSLLLFTVIFLLLKKYSTSTALRYVGVFIFITGFVCCGAILIGSDFINSNLPNWIPQEMGNIAHVGIDVIKEIFSSVLQMILICSAIVAGLGLIIFASSFFLKKKVETVVAPPPSV